MNIQCNKSDCSIMYWIVWIEGNFHMACYELTLERYLHLGVHFTNASLLTIQIWWKLETSPCCNSVRGVLIATKFCTCHDNTIVIPCATFYSNHFVRFWIRVKWNFHHIWIVMGKLLGKWTLWSALWLMMTWCKSTKPSSSTADTDQYLVCPSSIENDNTSRTSY